ncbi:TadE/TadG family type IV pilus assembly protein [Methylobacter svalbardensis]|uniref:TadE/TadG family type IV pilus assembly protein n=1 Tax=Methylobacter svalbardensis TaxID=3080016 RepID=UPI0030EE2942
MLLFKQSIKKFETGAALIEFAIIVPLLLLLVVGISEFGFAFYHLNILNKSVQDGARYFSDSSKARNGDIDMPIDTNPATNGTNINNTKNLVIYGNINIPSPCTSSTMPPCPLMPTAGNYTPLPTVTSPDANHIMVTATYNHNLMTNDLLSNLMKLVSGGNSSVGSDIPLTASSVLRVE